MSTTSGFASIASNTAPSAFAGLADGLDVLLGIEQQPEARADDGMVVDDEDANRHRQRHLGDERRPGCPALDSTRAGRRASATRSRMPTRPRPPLARLRVEARAVVLDHARTRSRPCASSMMLTLRAPACLTTFVSASCTIR